MAVPGVGDKAPTFTLPRDGGGSLSLADFKGRKLVLYFYPKADTPGCTKEAIAFNGLRRAFAKADTEIVGVSADPVKAQDKFREKYSLNYYVHLAKELEKMGAHVLGIKDMAGLCKPYAAFRLVRALKQEIGVPIHFHTHDTSGINASSVFKACEAGVDAADGAIAS